MNRYEFTDTENRRYKKTVYDLPLRNEVDKFIISREGDRLDLLANEFYQDATKWWIIAEANQLGKGSFTVPPGIQLRIPTITPVELRESLKESNRTK